MCSADMLLFKDSILTETAENEIWHTNKINTIFQKAVLSAFSTSDFEDRFNMKGNINSLHMLMKRALRTEDNIPEIMLGLSKTK